MKVAKQSALNWISLSALLPLFFGTAELRSAEGPGWGHLIFNEKTDPVRAVPDSGGERGKSMALLVSSRNNREWDHRANSILADLSFLEYESGGKALLKPGEGKEETLLIVAEGAADIQIGSFHAGVEKEDLILVPAGMSFAAKVRGAGPFRLVKAVWREEGPIPTPNVSPVVRSESRNPFDYFNAGGYVTVAPSARQKESGLVIVGAGGHTRLSASLMFYPQDLESRHFKGNSLLVRSALSQYGPEGGTPSHSHHDREQAFFILSGRALFEIGATTREVKAGDLIFAPLQVFHGSKVIGREPIKYIEMEWGYPW